MPREQRITLAQVSPNPLFERWLAEWLNYAEQKNSMRKHALAKALDSLRRYPLVLHSGRDCSILDGFGQTICRMLDKQLEVHRNNNVAPNGRPALDEADADRTLQEVVVKVQVRMKEQAQRQRKRAKMALQRDEAALGKIVTGDDPIVDLYDKHKDPSGAEATDDCINIADEQCGSTVIVPANSYEIILLVDTQETAGKSKRSLDVTIKELELNKVSFAVRRLSVGDFLWICRSRSDATQEYVLPYIVERKRMDDLAGSIKDGRFHEQKFRLADSGIANVVYMIENRGDNQHVGMPLANLLQAATNTEVQNGFVVKFTDSHIDSMRYLVTMTELLHEMYKDKSLVVTTKSSADAPLDTGNHIPVLEFKHFTASTTKMRNFPIRDLFVRQLLQLKTLTLDKALAIVHVYPTPSRLLRAYAQCAGGQREAETLLANITFGPAKKTIGPVISKCLYQFYHAQQPS